MRLGVNIDHVATVREARKTNEPDPVAAAVLVELAGADGLVCHLREDRRHLQDRDLYLLREVVRSHLNLEMAATKDMTDIAVKVKPDMATIVPEKREEVTTEGGLNVVENFEIIKDTAMSLRDSGIIVSLFIDPDLEQVKASAKAGADYIEIHTGKYADAEDAKSQEEELEKIQSMAYAGSKLGLGVSAGHGLTYLNVQGIARLDKIEELNIGHSIISRSLFTGIERAVLDMIDLINF
ncbi:MAG: pyridoxine 5'-phosphate synthase [bacterium]|nr:pyridoxine 5'-phosphate synthase [bacterium]